MLIAFFIVQLSARSFELRYQGWPLYLVLVLKLTPLMLIFVRRLDGLRKMRYFLDVTVVVDLLD